MDAYKVVRRFEYHDGKRLKKFERGGVISSKEASGIRSWSNLVNGGFVQLAPTDIKFREVVEEVPGDEKPSN